MKTGSVTNAIDDFMKLNPTQIRNGPFSTDAWFGDVYIQLKRKDISQKRHPSITISHPGNVASIKIVYE